MKKKIILVFSVLVLVFGIFVFKKFSTNNKMDKNENLSSNTITEKKSSNGNKEDTKKESNSKEELTLENLKSQKKPIILDFSQNGWHACAVQHPVLEKLREEYKDKVIIKTVDIRKEQKFASEFPIRVTPTLFYYNADGTPFKVSEDLAKKINYVAYQDKKTDELKFGGSESVVEYEGLKEIIEEMLKNVK